MRPDMVGIARCLATRRPSPGGVCPSKWDGVLGRARRRRCQKVVVLCRVGCQALGGHVLGDTERGIVQDKIVDFLWLVIVLCCKIGSTVGGGYQSERRTTWVSIVEDLKDI